MKKKTHFLNANTATVIRERYSTGSITLFELAKLYDTTTRTIRRIISNESYFNPFYVAPDENEFDIESAIAMEKDGYSYSLISKACSQNHRYRMTDAQCKREIANHTNNKKDQ